MDPRLRRNDTNDLAIWFLTVRLCPPRNNTAGFFRTEIIFIVAVIFNATELLAQSSFTEFCSYRCYLLRSIVSCREKLVAFVAQTVRLPSMLLMRDTGANDIL